MRASILVAVLLLPAMSRAADYGEAEAALINTQQNNAYASGQYVGAGNYALELVQRRWTLIDVYNDKFDMMSPQQRTNCQTYFATALTNLNTADGILYTRVDPVTMMADNASQSYLDGDDQHGAAEAHFNQGNWNATVSCCDSADEYFEEVIGYCVEVGPYLNWAAGALNQAEAILNGV